MDRFSITILLLCIPIVYWLYKKYLVPRKQIIEEPISILEPVVTEQVPTKQKLDYGLVSKCSDIACYHSDIGVVAPLEVYSEYYYILPYQKTDLQVQESLVLKLKELHPNMKREDILEQWTGSDVMYVMITHMNECIGSIAVDRKNFDPFISYVYVDPAYRKKGYGERLLQHGEDYAREFKFKEVKLWCKQELIPYYTRYGWEKIGDKPVTDSFGNEVWIMKKGLVSSPRL